MDMLREREEWTICEGLPHDRKGRNRWICIYIDIGLIEVSKYLCQYRCLDICICIGTDKYQYMYIFSLYVYM